MSGLWRDLLAAEPALQVLLGLHVLGLASLGAGLLAARREPILLGRGLSAGGVVVNLLLLGQMGLASGQLPGGTLPSSLLLGTGLLALLAWREGGRSPLLGLLVQGLLVGLLGFALGPVDADPAPLGPLQAGLLAARLAAGATLTMACLLALPGLLGHAIREGSFLHRGLGTRGPWRDLRVLPWVRVALAALGAAGLLAWVQDSGEAPGWTLAALLACAGVLHVRRVPPGRRPARSAWLLSAWLLAAWGLAALSHRDARDPVSLRGTRSGSASSVIREVLP